jgi:parallel beta-helix repeat protein
VGQSDNDIVRNSVAHGNVIGIEIENTRNGEVYGNEAYDNSCGYLICNLPDLPGVDGRGTRVHDNLSENNNHENFAIPGNTVADVPSGTGIMIKAYDNVEIDSNTIQGNDGTVYCNQLQHPDAAVG